MDRTINLTLMALLASTALTNVAWAQQAAAPAQPAPAPAAPVEETVTVTAVPLNESILPTTISSSSVYGLDLGVMDTPRNNTMLTHAQLDALNIQDPHEFSYLTSSSYTDAAFGVPDVPRIRGQYGDVFFNGMRDSFTSNGYGAPLSFNSFDTIDIVKGPASVQAGPGQGVGGSIDITTKLPNVEQFGGTASVEFDTVDHRRWGIDFGGPISGTSAAYRISYAGEQSGSYYNDQFFDEHSVYAVLLANPTDKYSVQFNTELVYQHYTENDGVNRVSQQLIDHGLYLTGQPPADEISSFLTPVHLDNQTLLGDRVNIDEGPGTSALAWRYNAQAIQTYTFNDAVTLTNNTFFNYLNRQNQVVYYFADTAEGSYTIENKTDLKIKFDTPIGDANNGGWDLKNEINAGGTFRFAHVDELQAFLTEPVSVWNLAGNPASWVYPQQFQSEGGAIPIVAADGRIQYAVPGRNSGAYNATIDSNLYDFAAFLEHRIQVTPEVSVLYGLRGDLVQLDESDPIGGAVYGGLPDTHSTAWYGLGNGNFSPVYEFAPWGTFYATYNYAQYVDPNSNDGGVGTFGIVDHTQLQQSTRLYETGLKFNLFDKSLFISSALFSQERGVPTGPGGIDSSRARITGEEIELNYQPNRNFFTTASFSNIHTRLDTAAGFYNYPAHPGVNYDGAGALAVFYPGQHFDDPGLPQETFNLLSNYKFPSGFGVQGSVQVTGPIETSTSGYINVAASGGAPYVPQSVIANHGYYQSPVIPWQYTMNLSLYYEADPYLIKLSVYNVTDQHNLINDYPFYGNDFITRAPPTSFDLTMKVKF